MPADHHGHSATQAQSGLRPAHKVPPNSRRSGRKVLQRHAGSSNPTPPGTSHHLNSRTASLHAASGIKQPFLRTSEKSNGIGCHAQQSARGDPHQNGRHRACSCAHYPTARFVAYQPCRCSTERSGARLKLQPAPMPRRRSATCPRRSSNSVRRSRLASPGRRAPESVPPCPSVHCRRLLICAEHVNKRLTESYLP